MQDASTIFSFGEWQLNPAARELTWRARVRPVPPKVFDLLHHLIRHRVRVVSKAELMDQLWPDSDITESAMVRTVMLARRALAVDVAGPSLIATVHSTGYRFLGEVKVGVTADPGARRAGLQVAFLPIVNLTGDAGLDWVTRGLATLMGQRLDQQSACHVITTSETLPALAHLPKGARGTARANAAAAMLGLDLCIDCELQRAEAGALRLVYQCHAYRRRPGPGEGEVIGAATRMFGLPNALGAPPISLLNDATASASKAKQGALEGADATELGRRLVEILRDEIEPSRHRGEMTSPDDAFLDQLLARALQRLGEFQFRSAAALLRAVLELAPEHRSARVALLTALINSGSGEAESLAAQTMALAQARGDGMLQAVTHQSLAHSLAYSDQEGAVGRALQHASKALMLSQPDAEAPWALRLRLLHARLSILQGNLDEAERLYRHVEDAGPAHGGPLLEALARDGHAWLALEKGQLEQALSLWSQASAFYGLHRIDGLHALTLMNLAEVQVALGHVPAARNLALRSEALFDRIAQPSQLGSIARAAAGAYLGMGSAADFQRVLARLEDLRPAGATHEDWGWRIASAHDAMCREDRTGVRRELEGAWALARRIGSPTRECATLRVALSLGSWAEDPSAPERWREEIERFLGDAHHPALKQALLARQPTPIAN